MRSWTLTADRLRLLQTILSEKDSDHWAYWGETISDAYPLLLTAILDVSCGFRAYREKHGAQSLQRFFLSCVAGKEFQAIYVLASISDNGADPERWMVEAWRELNLNFAIDGEFGSSIDRCTVIADVAEACVYQENFIRPLDDETDGDIQGESLPETDCLFFY